MRVTVARLLRTEALRFGVVYGSIVLWFLLILGVVKGAKQTVTTKVDMAGGSLMQGFGIGNLSTPDSFLQQMAGVSFNHPIVLALVGALTTALGVRACQGELLQGTLEVTLAGPVRRTNYLLGYVAVMVVATAGLMFVAWAAMLGLDWLLDVPGTIAVGDAARACAVGFATFLTFGAIALLVSVLLGRHGSAMFTTVGVLVAMFALTFAERAWSNDVVQWLAPVSVFHWFDPGATLGGAPVRVRDWLVPLLESAGCIAAACVIFERRDL